MKKRPKTEQGRVIAYRPALRNITGSVNSALLLSQLDYWWDLKSGAMLYKTDSELAKELNFGLKELRNAKQKLIDSGLITVVLKGIPQTTHYSLKTRVGNLLDSAAQKVNKVTSKGKVSKGNRAAKSLPKGQTNSCITQETTQKKNDKDYYMKPNRSFDEKTSEYMLKIFLARWQQIVTNNKWALQLEWHRPSPEVDARIVESIQQYGGIDGLINELEKRCEAICEQDAWRTYEDQPLNLTFLLNAEPSHI